jgi:DNA-binding beta-propeller fold protein YncE
VAGLSHPAGLEFGPGCNLYVASVMNFAVLEYDGTTGAFSRSINTGTFSYPADVAFSPNGNLYVTTYVGNTVEEYDGSTGASIGTLSAPEVADSQGRWD